MSLIVKLFMVRPFDKLRAHHERLNLMAVRGEFGVGVSTENLPFRHGCRNGLNFISPAPTNYAITSIDQKA